ncbi:nicotinic acid mononucleotide adenylyltransferase [Marichromatium purpuratum 984]|uniref:Probable nicotinate-nucleotide adenylyltransferase n=1 Tax=Marichromatium purpuratum 984 TaxID=765910 RepID=W0DVV3_MARPU|nr:MULTISPECIES: nicotinate-nucleotide adenylyltransferase [Marichromatium]AHF02577.1 nicotinic acid mononucleotide adenylyltransferase [Marichromatium purpuratum 984]RNE93892.1 nicotinate-nucleotide adenylyltransferase [Marichromatium sp. AB32]
MIGIFGGTFDPVHFGHLRPALECLQGLDLEQLRFIPLKVPVHRPQPCASPAARLAMLEAAIADEPRFMVDARELERPGRSYSYDTLASLRAELGAQRPLCLLVGADAFAAFLRWHRPQEILELAHLVVMRRPGHRALVDPELEALYARRGSDTRAELARAPGGRILFQEVTQIDISATRIRRLLATGQSPRYLLPEPVRAYIARTGVYDGCGMGELPA